MSALQSPRTSSHSRGLPPESADSSASRPATSRNLPSVVSPTAVCSAASVSPAGWSHDQPASDHSARAAAPATNRSTLSKGTTTHPVPVSDPPDDGLPSAVDGETLGLQAFQFDSPCPRSVKPSVDETQFRTVVFPPLPSRQRPTADRVAKGSKRDSASPRVIHGIGCFRPQRTQDTEQPRTLPSATPRERLGWQQAHPGGMMGRRPPRTRRSRPPPTPGTCHCPTSVPCTWPDCAGLVGSVSRAASHMGTDRCLEILRKGWPRRFRWSSEWPREQAAGCSGVWSRGVGQRAHHRAAGPGPLRSAWLREPVRRRRGPVFPGSLHGLTGGVTAGRVRAFDRTAMGPTCCARWRSRAGS
jgi:hypothetical protein